MIMAVAWISGSVCGKVSGGNRELVFESMILGNKYVGYKNLDLRCIEVRSNFNIGFSQIYFGVLAYYKIAGHSLASFQGLFISSSVLGLTLVIFPT